MSEVPPHSPLGDIFIQKIHSDEQFDIPVGLVIPWQSTQEIPENWKQYHTPIVEPEMIKVDPVIFSLLGITFTLIVAYLARKLGDYVARKMKEISRRQ